LETARTHMEARPGGISVRTKLTRNVRYLVD
jgi:hypothetical protein